MPRTLGLHRSDRADAGTGYWGALTGAQIRECVERYAYTFLFSVEDMRNAYLKDVRAEWKDSRYLQPRAVRTSHPGPMLSGFPRPPLCG